MTPSIPHTALALHLAIEIPASLNFLLRPSVTLTTAQPQAHGLIRQYALLLLSTNLIALILLCRPVDRLTAQISGALALYHLGPLVRAGSRIRRGELAATFGGPWVHAVAHAICVVVLLMAYLREGV